jgi:hypothetical protein
MFGITQMVRLYEQITLFFELSFDIPSAVFTDIKTTCSVE